MSNKDLKYKNKYLKYKNKYLDLQSQIGGVRLLSVDGISQYRTYPPQHLPPPSPTIYNKLTTFLNKFFKTDTFKTDTFILKNKEDFDKFFFFLIPDLTFTGLPVDIQQNIVSNLKTDQAFNKLSYDAIKKTVEENTFTLLKKKLQL